MRHQTRQSVSALLAVAAVLGLPAANAIAATGASAPTAKQKAAAAKKAAAARAAAAKKAAAAKAAAAARKAAATTTAAATGPKSYVGETVDMHWGPVTVTIVVENGKVTSATADLPVEKARSEYINSRVGPYLNAQAVQIQSAQVDLIGGATQSCEAYAQSLQSALDKANIKATTSAAGA